MHHPWNHPQGMRMKKYKVGIPGKELKFIEWYLLNANLMHF
jgi:hypothetical protein